MVHSRGGWNIPCTPSQKLLQPTYFKHTKRESTEILALSFPIKEAVMILFAKNEKQLSTNEGGGPVFPQMITGGNVETPLMY